MISSCCSEGLAVADWGGCPPRWGMPRRPDYPSWGDRAAEVAGLLGFDPMPWQLGTLAGGLEVVPAGSPDGRGGRLAYSMVVVTVPRQSGKTVIIFVVSTLRALAFGPSQSIAYTAQDRISARKKFEQYVELLRASAAFKERRDFTVRFQNGQERVVVAAAVLVAEHAEPVELRCRVAVRGRAEARVDVR